MLKKKKLKSSSPLSIAKKIYKDKISLMLQNEKKMKKPRRKSQKWDRIKWSFFQLNNSKLLKNKLY